MNGFSFFHEPENARAKGKIERVFRFIQERFTPEYTDITLEGMAYLLYKWIEWYNTCHIHRDTNVVIKARLKPSVMKPIDGINLAYFLRFKEIRRIAKESFFKLGGITYTIPKQHN